MKRHNVLKRKTNNFVLLWQKKTRQKLSALAYLGGKSVNATQSTGRWIHSLLPISNTRSIYVEPFCGMCGVLLQRPPLGCEVINDLNSRLINWWRVIRDSKMRQNVASMVTS